MDKGTLRWTALAFCCLLLAGCKPRHEPVKPPLKPIAAAVAAG